MQKIEGTLDYYTYINKINYILIELTGQKNIQPIELRMLQLSTIFTEIFKKLLLPSDISPGIS